MALFAFADGKPVKVMLLAGADLIESFGVPDLWAADHVGSFHDSLDFKPHWLTSFFLWTCQLHHICGHYGCLIIDREGSDAHDFMMSSDVLYQHRVRLSTTCSYLPFLH